MCIDAAAALQSKDPTTVALAQMLTTTTSRDYGSYHDGAVNHLHEAPRSPSVVWWCGTWCVEPALQNLCFPCSFAACERAVQQEATTETTIMATITIQTTTVTTTAAIAGLSVLAASHGAHPDLCTVAGCPPVPSQACWEARTMDFLWILSPAARWRHRDHTFRGRGVKFTNLTLRHFA